MRGLWLLMLLVAACDTGGPTDADVLVVEAFFDVGQPLPNIRVQRAAPVEGAYPDPTAVGLSDADVTVIVETTVVPYVRDPARPGVYLPGVDEQVVAGAHYRVEVAWRGQRVRAQTRTPPRLDVASLRVKPFEAPIRAVLLDSLRFDTLGTGARQGFIYPVEVFATWAAAPPPNDSLLWMRTQLRPARDFSSTVIDFFFPPERIVAERDLALDGDHRSWRGLYVIPVDSATSRLPAHRVRVALVRSGQDYARFAATRTTPARREPRSNVVGGRGIVAGISVDSVVVDVSGAQ